MHRLRQITVEIEQQKARDPSGNKLPLTAYTVEWSHQTGMHLVGNRSPFKHSSLLQQQHFASSAQLPPISRIGPRTPQLILSTNLNSPLPNQIAPAMIITQHILLI